MLPKVLKGNAFMRDHLPYHETGHSCPGHGWDSSAEPSPVEQPSSGQAWDLENRPSKHKLQLEFFFLRKEIRAVQINLVGLDDSLHNTARETRHKS